MLKVNEYFAGKVKSIGFDSSSIGLTSVGVMEEEYTFSTAQPEEMTVITGALKFGRPDCGGVYAGREVLRAGAQRIQPAGGRRDRLSVPLPEQINFVREGSAGLSRCWAPSFLRRD